MTEPEIKNKIHEMIEGINDPDTLEEVETIVGYITAHRENWDDLPDAVKNAIEDGLAQFERGEKLSYEEVKQKHSRWFIK